MPGETRWPEFAPHWSWNRGSQDTRQGVSAELGSLSKKHLRVSEAFLLLLWLAQLVTPRCLFLSPSFSCVLGLCLETLAPRGLAGEAAWRAAWRRCTLPPAVAPAPLSLSPAVRGHLP